MQARPWWQQARLALLDLLFPPRCASCGRYGEWFCARCAAALPVLRPPLCPRCGQETDNPAVCQSCLRHALPEALSGLRAIAKYEGGLRQAIHALKYEQMTVLAEPLGKLLAAYMEIQKLPATLLVPVPLHPARERERGYNQSTLLARVIAEQMQIPMSAHAIERGRNTPPQVGLGASARRANMAGAFICPRRLDGEHVVIIDDVCTTGATLSECAIAVKSAGAETIWGLTLAR